MPKKHTYFQPTKTDLNITSGPVTTNLDTGVATGLVVSPLQKETSEGWSPLFINGQIFSPTGIATPKDSKINYAREYFENIILPALNTMLWRNVNFKTQFEASTIGAAMSYASYALSLYYTSEAVLRYVDDQSTQNLGLYALRDLFTADLMQMHMRLKQRLEQIYFPPNANLLNFNLHKLYTFSEMPGSPIVMHQHGNMFSPDGMPGQSTYAKLGVDLYQQFINKLSTYQLQFALLAKIKPEWKVKLHEMPGTATIDPNFTTHLVNSGTVYVPTESTVVHSRTYSSETMNNPSYQIFNNKLDGAIYALDNRYLGGENKNVYPGFTGSNQQIVDKVGFTNKLVYKDGKMAYLSERDFFETSGFAYSVGSDSKEAVYLTRGSELASKDRIDMMITASDSLSHWLWNLDDLLK